ncbi:hypothetical protein DM01DRAFT_1302469 [Hesseltinella vesiculosa]|uniref:TFIIS N-terminal domain-containing protein n=1 Tax=Hesseltinella vesiculosa TaxID=101127 RepID=A0A1X2GML4_9FUNG|nr:hypothetical protein DM01DRAFT_1302469 [Hesseltinella vesiculosa]
MSDQEELLNPQHDALNESESEISDLDDDQGSDDAASFKDTADDDDNNNSNAKLTSQTAHQLPSFKRRERTQEEKEELEKLRQDLRQQKQDRTDQDDNLPPLDPREAVRNEVAEVFNRALKSSGKKRRRLEGDDLNASRDEELSNLSERMKVAAEADNIANEQQKPAIAKLKMLDEVTVTLNNSGLFDSILDNQLLDAIRLWLEPLPDRALPTLEIQNEMLDILDKLPAAAEHLRESGIGKIVLFYKKSPRADARVQRKAEHLIAKWTRLVLRRSENYRERSHQVQDYSHDDIQQRRKVFKAEDAAKDIDQTRMHVSIPFPVAPDYDIAPRSNVTGRSKAQMSMQYRRIKSTMRTLSTPASQRKKKDA